MTKRSLLAVAIATLGIQSVQAAPFLPMDARGLAMGNTGVASAQRAHAPAYNPSLLSQASEDDDFAIIFPQLGINVADEEELVDSAQDINDEIVPRFENLFDDSRSNNFTDSVEKLADAADSLATAIANINGAGSTADKAATLKTANTNFSNSLNEVQSQLNEVNSVTSDLAKSLNNISGDPLRGRLGLGGALAIPSKKFAAAISMNADVTFSGRAFFTQQDQNLIQAYGLAANEYVDIADGIPDQINAVIDTLEGGNTPTPGQVTQITQSVDDVQDFNSSPVETAAGTISIFNGGKLSPEAEDAELNSQVQVVAIAVAELALSFSREFEIYGENIAFGITPKLQKISTLHYVSEMDNEDDIETDDIEDSREDYSKVNLDIGASYRFGSDGNWMVGVVGKNLLGGEFDYAEAEVKGSPEKDYDNNPATPNTPLFLKGGSIALNPQYRAGIAYNGDWATVSFDLDLSENEPVAFENPTQYAAIGAEFDIFRTLQLRAGYRTNMSVADAEIVSIGFGLSPFGVHLDIAAMANPNDPEKEAGIALETGFYF
ncbi:MAG: conjugal transfer protein TraF [Saccharospirillaceae bacterium]|nr:conjugal transfer protein TraF [Saccharospirillaceae bacterium]MCD8530321.1 conjugal transfer protein TraF [Saccharospirillaceae bacterium]